MKTAIIATLFTTACLAMPAGAEVFTLSVGGQVSGIETVYGCGPGSYVYCGVTGPFTASVRSGTFSLDLNEGSNFFSYGSPYASGLFSGTIINTNRVLTGVSLGFSSRSCAPGIPSPGCVDRMGSAATFNVFGGIPEPDIWGLMLAGLGAVGLAMRRRGGGTTIRPA